MLEPDHLDERDRREWAMNGGGGQDYFFFTTAFNDIPVAERERALRIR
jgi:hypothetical protein